MYLARLYHEYVLLARLDLYLMCRAEWARTYNLNDHVENVHLKIRKWLCHVEGCPKSVQGYSRKGDLQRHEESAHGHTKVGSSSRVTKGKIKVGAKGKAAVAAAAQAKEEMD